MVPIVPFHIFKQRMGGKMFGTINVNVDSVQLRDYADKLENVHNSMLTEIEELKRNYKQAQWNDMVSEKARVQLNQYIDALNFAIGDLNSVISCVEKMLEELDDYENSMFHFHM